MYVFQKDKDSKSQSPPSTVYFIKLLIKDKTHGHVVR